VSAPPPSPKRRLRAVYQAPDNEAQTEPVTYQLEDTGHAVLRLRPTVRVVDEGGVERFLYRVDAYSRMTGRHLGLAEVLASPDSPAEFAARAREFQSLPFREVVDELSDALVERFADRDNAAAAERLARATAENL
jgi:hypothetical protein